MQFFFQIVAEIYYSGACVKEEPDLPGCNSLGHYYKLFDLRRLVILLLLKLV